MDKMHTLDEAVLESTLVNDELPPPYTASDSTAPSYTPYAKFPRIMNAYAGWNATSIYISGSGSDKSDRLYCADYHMGYSSKGPLGSRLVSSTHPVKIHYTLTRSMSAQECTCTTAPKRRAKC